MPSPSRVVRVSFLLLAFGVLAASNAGATPINYLTTGGVGGAPDSPITFQAVPGGGSFDPPASFTLGEFHVAALPEGQSKTFTNTQFLTTLTLLAPGPTIPTSKRYDLLLTGRLDGTLTGPSQSSVVMTITSVTPAPVPLPADPAFDPIVAPPFPLDLLKLDGPLALNPASVAGGITVFHAQVAAPELSTFSIFALAMGGLGLRCHWNRRRVALAARAKHPR
jgi:hypothetical protein